MTTQDHRAIFITGASSGLGRATAKLFASHGWKVIVSMRDPDAVLNGIAYDPESDRLFVTGKLWSKLFEIKVVRREVHK